MRNILLYLLLALGILSASSQNYGDELTISRRAEAYAPFHNYSSANYNITFDAPASKIDYSAITPEYIDSMYSHATAIEFVDDVDPRYQIIRSIDLNPWSILTRIGTKFALRIAVTDVLKHNIHEWRPDGSSDNSFPSRHAIWAYGIAGSIGYSTAGFVPEMPVALHTLANAMGMQRVMARRHWPGDVMAGAGIGLVLNIGAEAFVDALFKTHRRFDFTYYNLDRNVFSVESNTGLFFPSSRDFGNYRLCTAFTCGFSASASVYQRLGIKAEADVLSAPVKLSGNQPAGTPVAGVVNSVAFYVGPKLDLCLEGSRFGLAVSGMVGYNHNFAGGDISVGGSAPSMRADLGASFYVTPRLSFGASAGYATRRIRINDTRRDTSGLQFSFASSVAF